ncbi:MAG: metalloregulator ArsR/SmtB family transcription factor [Treponema sp.]|nr:metalloregulator ArsR/SmtB family transcription factor [Treponema sp.]
MSSSNFKIDFLQKELSQEEMFLDVSRIFSLLSDSTRLKIFWLLCHAQECVNDIVQMMDMTMPAVSHHLKILKDAGMIESYRDGKEVFYSAPGTEKNKMLHEMMEKLMEISCPDFEGNHEQINENSKYLENQVEAIKKVHERLTENLSRRITIEELAHEFYMNPTTLKTVFKDVYGTSVAAHIKKHRMEKAAELLVSTDLSVNEIARLVGYESQSKFSATFKDFYAVTPNEYKKSCTKKNGLQNS